MIVDTSAVLAVLFDESDADEFDDVIARARRRRMSVANYVEATIVSEGRRSSETRTSLDAYIEEAGIELVAVSHEQALAARTAWRRYGKGNHPASLNYGDCFAYALAKITGEPLLFKGRDFARTDIESAQR